MSAKQVYEILIGQKVLGPDGKWHVYDANGVELSHPDGIVWRANPGALLTWPKVDVTDFEVLPGAYTITGFPATFVRNRVFVAQAGSYGIEGKQARMGKNLRPEEPDGVGPDEIFVRIPREGRIARQESEWETFVPADVLAQQRFDEDEILLALIARAVTSGALNQWH